MSKREELIREYCRQVNESLHFIQKYMEGIVPAGRCSEELYWETKKISEELQKSNHEQTALIRAICGNGGTTVRRGGALEDPHYGPKTLP